MKVIARGMLRDFWEKHPDAEAPLMQWYRDAKRAIWSSFADVRNTFGFSDLVGECVVFNIHGNAYRLVVKVSYQRKIIYTRLVMKHSDYNKKGWQKDECGCK